MCVACHKKLERLEPTRQLALIGVDSREELLFSNDVRAWVNSLVEDKPSQEELTEEASRAFIGIDESWTILADFAGDDDVSPTDDEIAVANARSLLSDYEDVDTETRHGAIKHAIGELENARRELPDER